MPSKAAMIRAWQRLAPPDHEALGGHSARRTGAKRLARAGWATDAIQYLGRWASAVVLGYIEEAAADLPIQTGGPGLMRRLGESHPLAARIDALDDLATKVRSLDADLSALHARVGQLQVVDAQASTEDSKNSVILHMTYRTAHIARSRAPGAPACEWRTRCGWLYGVTCVFAMVDEVPEAYACCSRCFPAPSVPS